MGEANRDIHVEVHHAHLLLNRYIAEATVEALAGIVHQAGHMEALPGHFGHDPLHRVGRRHVQHQRMRAASVQRPGTFHHPLELVARTGHPKDAEAACRQFHRDGFPEPLARTGHDGISVLFTHGS